MNNLIESEDVGTAEQWAKRISELMSEEEFSRFVWFFDGTDDIEFWEELTKLDAARHPERYVDRPSDPEVVPIPPTDKASLRGFTLTELMIVIAIFGVLLSILLFSCKGLMTGDAVAEAATSDARKFVRDLGWAAKGISCADVDSDGDGYVSCTIALENRTNEFVECRGAYSFGHGCRIPKLRVDRNVR